MKSEAELSLLARQWGATAVPFGLVNAKDWLDTPGAQKALACLSQTAALRSVMLLCGPNGVGKSALAGRWMRGLDARLFFPVCLTQATLSGNGILASVCAKLGKPGSFRRERNLQLIEQALDQLERRIPVVILDEAQNYSHSTLEEVRLLLGLNMPEQPAFALVLIGDDYLLASLKLRNQRALYSRLACQISLGIPQSGTRAMRPVLKRRIGGCGLERFGPRNRCCRTAGQCQRRPAPQPLPVGTRRVDPCRHRRRTKDHGRPRQLSHRNGALCAGLA